VDLTRTGAVGYNVRFGTIKEKLYLDSIVYEPATTKLTIRGLAKKENYFFTIDAFNEDGITRGRYRAGVGSVQ
jgi:hypothetical protein